MRLPILSDIPKSRDYQIQFKGYNHNLYVDETQFFDTQNLCATNYPVMSPRAARGIVRQLSKPQGMFSHGKLCWVDDGLFYYDGVQYGTKLTGGEKQFAGMGAYVLIFPDAMRFNTVTKAWDSLTSEWTAEGKVSVSLCKADGSDYGNVTASEAAPEGAESGEYWLDTSNERHVLRIYSNGSWVSIATTYVRIEAVGIGSAFTAGDTVQIDGCTTESINGAHTITARTDDSITVSGIIDKVSTQTGGMSVKRSIPQMDFVCELNNRIWGCSNEKHEIYACKLGDAANWYCYDGLASDSYAATVGSAGDFTGCCAFGGQVLFFKEDVLHKVMGTKPSNFQITDSPIRGVQKGSEKSLVIVNETLFYKSRESICAYDGGTPMDVSDALGNVLYTDAAAGVQGDRYYISMRGEDGAWQMFVFDEAKGLWYREDTTHASAFAALGGQLYYLDAERGRMTAVRGTAEAGAQIEAAIEWYAETGDMLVDMPDNKYVSRIQIRAGVEKGSTIKVEAQYDSSGKWITVWERGYSRKASFTIPIIPMRCDHMRLRISGKGRSCVYALSKEIEKGSEL